MPIAHPDTDLRPSPVPGVGAKARQTDGPPPPNGAYDLLVSLTDLCNARCVMCNIWQNRKSDESFLPVALAGRVVGAETVSLAGGEPFMHKDVVEVARAIHEQNPRAKLVFSSNGFQTGHIVTQVGRILAFHPNLQVTISLDGIGTVHDEIRGIEGAFEKVIRTFDGLGAIGLRNRNFAFTITETNVDALPDVYAFVREKGAGLSLAVAQSSKFLGVDIPPLAHDRVFPVLNPIIDDHLRSWRPLNWARAFFFWGMLRYLATHKRPITCDAFQSQAMVDQTGTVWSCHPLMERGGSLADAPLHEVLSTPEVRDQAQRLASCHACWEVCTVRSGIRRAWFRVGVWCAIHKLLAHLRLRGGRRGSRLFPNTRSSPVSG